MAPASGLLPRCGRDVAIACSCLFPAGLQLTIIFFFFSVASRHFVQPPLAFLSCSP